MFRLAVTTAIVWVLFGNRKHRSSKLSFNKDKLPARPAAPMTARELLVEAFGEPRDEHADHTVDRWAKGANGALQIVCTCGGLATVLDTKSNRLCLQNMRKV